MARRETKQAYVFVPRDRVVRRGRYLPLVSDSEVQTELGIGDENGGLVRAGRALYVYDRQYRSIQWWSTELATRYTSTTDTWWRTVAANGGWASLRGALAEIQARITADQAKDARVAAHSAELDLIEKIRDKTAEVTLKLLTAELEKPEAHVDKLIGQFIALVKHGQVTRDKLLAAQTVIEAATIAPTVPALATATATATAAPNLLTSETPAAHSLPAPPKLPALTVESAQQIARLMLAKPKVEIGTIDDEDEDEDAE
jgi:hypothetical protein